MPSDRDYEARRRDRVTYRLWYKRAPWLRAREAQLDRQPLCERCLERGDEVPANVVNHRIPHKGDWSLFIDPENHESACKPCHDGEIQREERRGSYGVDRDGWPLNPNEFGAAPPRRDPAPFRCEPIVSRS